MLFFALSLPVVAMDVDPVRYDADNKAKAFSPSAKALLKEGVWWTVNTEHFDCWDRAKDALSRRADLIEYAYRKAGFWLGGEPAAFRGRYFLIDDPATWRRIPEVADRSDAVSFQEGPEVFVLVSAQSAVNAVRIAHEIVHLRLRQVCAGDLPLWIDEGLSSYLGWKIAEGYGRLQRSVLTQELPDLQAEQLVANREITERTTYPRSEAEARIFYRQADALIRAVAYRIGDDHLSEWLGALCGGKVSWQDVLTRDFGFSGQDFEALESEMKKNAMRMGGGR